MSDEKDITDTRKLSSPPESPTVITPVGSDDDDDDDNHTEEQQQILLNQLHEHVLDPYAFPRTALSHVSEKTERSAATSRSGSGGTGSGGGGGERYSEYAPSKPPSFLGGGSSSGNGSGGRQRYGGGGFREEQQGDSSGSSLYDPGWRSPLPPPSASEPDTALAQTDQEALRGGHLWFLNVHAPGGRPFKWVRAQATLYPTQLVLKWINTQGRGVVVLDLINCTEMRSVAPEDDTGRRRRRKDDEPLDEALFPFQMIYGDGVERLAAQSATKRNKWMSAIWDALYRGGTSMPALSSAGSTVSMFRPPTAGLFSTVRSESTTGWSDDFVTASGGSRTETQTQRTAPSTRGPYTETFSRCSSPTFSSLSSYAPTPTEYSVSTVRPPSPRRRTRRRRSPTPTQTESTDSYVAPPVRVVPPARIPPSPSAATTFSQMYATATEGQSVMSLEDRTPIMSPRALPALTPSSPSDSDHSTEVPERSRTPVPLLLAPVAAPSSPVPPVTISFTPATTSPVSTGPASPSSPLAPKVTSPPPPRATSVSSPKTSSPSSPVATRSNRTSSSRSNSRGITRAKSPTSISIPPTPPSLLPLETSTLQSVELSDALTPLSILRSPSISSSFTNGSSVASSSRKTVRWKRSAPGVNPSTYSMSVTDSFDREIRESGPSKPRPPPPISSDATSSTNGTVTPVAKASELSAETPEPSTPGRSYTSRGLPSTIQDDDVSAWSPTLTTLSSWRPYRSSYTASSKWTGTTSRRSRSRSRSRSRRSESVYSSAMETESAAPSAMETESVAQSAAYSESVPPSDSTHFAPSVSQTRSPSARSSASLWATETDATFRSSIFYPSPSVASTSLPPGRSRAATSTTGQSSYFSSVISSSPPESPRLAIKGFSTTLSTITRDFSTTSDDEDGPVDRQKAESVSSWVESVESAPYDETTTRGSTDKGESVRTVSYIVSSKSRWRSATPTSWQSQSANSLPGKRRPVRSPPSTSSPASSSLKTVSYRVYTAPSAASTFSTLAPDIIGEMEEATTNGLGVDFGRVLQGATESEGWQDENRRDFRSRLDGYEDGSVNTSKRIQGWIQAAH